jgi:hypothetical protein
MGVKPGRRATFFPVTPAGVEARKGHMSFYFLSGERAPTPSPLKPTKVPE